jgi:uncharacterized BrkB/YihY/UPF0761 family membrane protein
MGRVEDLRARAERYAERAEAVRQNHRSVDAVVHMADRDIEIGGAIMAGALAYRIFVWLLPFGLVLVGGIGVAADAADESSASAANSLGLQGIVSHSVSQASGGSSRWYAILIGIPILVWASRGLLKALIVVHRLVWGDVRREVAKPTVGATVRILLLFATYFAIREGVRAFESWSGSFVLGTVIGLLLVFLWWMLVSIRLPHRGAPWHALLPGAVIIALGFELVADVGTHLIAPRISSSESAYGALGVAATLLLGLFIISRLVVASAVVNATAWERRSEGAPDPRPGA